MANAHAEVLGYKGNIETTTSTKSDYRGSALMLGYMWLGSAGFHDAQT
jgi:hypothetical protein